MELDDVIKSRRSIRRYKDQPVPVDLVREVLEAGTWAPSAKNGQQWRFTVLTGQAKRALTDLFKRKLEVLSAKITIRNMGSSFSSCSIMEEAQVLIVVWNAGEMGHDTEVHSVAAAVQNMLLKAHALGLGTCWIGDIFYASDALKKHLGKPWKLTAAVTLGWPAEEPKPRPRKPVEEVTEFLD